MLERILDLHIHSKYSRACSKDLDLPHIAAACAVRGIHIVSTGDFTHPAWFRHLSESLVEDTDGLYRLKDNSSATRFMIGAEVASIKKDAGQTRRVHHLIFAPTLQVAAQFTDALEKAGCNVRSDGRPILGLTSKQILEMMLSIDERMVMIPAHAWTPWFGIFGSYGGYTSLAECYGELADRIFAIETGLSSDPLMNRRVSLLDRITLISNSDAHSTAKLGREANVMQFVSETAITYDEIMRILRTGDKERFLYTIEFYPEEGKYHLDGHRLCQVVCTPEETEKYGGICPVCKLPMTIGVMNRVATLSDRSAEQAALVPAIPFRSLVPLPEIIADTFGCGVSTKKVAACYQKLIDTLGTEFFILLHAPLADIARVATADVARGVERVRQGNIVIRPGFDGQFGVVKVFEQGVGDRQEKLLLG